MTMSKPELTRTHYCLLGALLAALVAWRAYTVFSEKPAEKVSVPTVRTITVKPSSDSGASVYPGEVRGKYESALAFQVAGKIVSRHVNLGDSVAAGQVLMELDPKDVAESVNAYRAAYSAADSNYKLAKDNYQRFEALYAKGAVSTMVRDQYRTQLEAAEANLKSAAAQLTAGENKLGYTRLTADHAGSIASISGEVGQVVAAGTPVVTLVQDGPREIHIYVPENKLDAIHPGQEASVTFWALGNTTAKGHISEIAPMADSVTRTYKVKVTLDNMPGKAKLGMTAKVSLKTGSGSSVLLPSTAVYQTGDQPGVWVIRDKKAVLVPVKTEAYEGNRVRITEGLSEGDLVVTGGITKLAEGQEVRLEGSEYK